MAFVWVVGRFIDPLLPWFLRDVVVVVGLLGFVCIVAIIGIWGDARSPGGFNRGWARCARAAGTAGRSRWPTA